MSKNQTETGKWAESDRNKGNQGDQSKIVRICFTQRHKVTKGFHVGARVVMVLIKAIKVIRGFLGTEFNAETQRTRRKAMGRGGEWVTG